jgi:hypothetical protein
MNYYRDIAVLAFPTPKKQFFRIKNAGAKAGFDSPLWIQPEIEEFRQMPCCQRQHSEFNG